MVRQFEHATRQNFSCNANLRSLSNKCLLLSTVALAQSQFESIRRCGLALYGAMREKCSSYRPVCSTLFAKKQNFAEIRYQGGFTLTLVEISHSVPISSPPSSSRTSSANSKPNTIFLQEGIRSCFTIILDALPSAAYQVSKKKKAREGFQVES